MRRRSTLIWIILALVLTCAFNVPVAGAELPSEALSGFPQASESAKAQEAEESEEASASAPASSSGSSSTIILVLVAAGLVLAGIAFVIVRDARKAAPVAEGPSIDGSAGKAAELRKRRAKAKAARRQRTRQRQRKR